MQPCACVLCGSRNTWHRGWDVVVVNVCGWVDGSEEKWECVAIRDIY